LTNIGSLLMFELRSSSLNSLHFIYAATNTAFFSAQKKRKMLLCKKICFRVVESEKQILLFSPAAYIVYFQAKDTDLFGFE
jgi:hypothetical protein